MANFLKDRVIVVTGAAKGFGKLICEKAGQLGAAIVALDNDDTALQALQSSLSVAGVSITARTLDVTDRAAFADVIDLAVTTYGRVDILINNAGTMPLAFIADHQLAAAAWERCIDINIKGVLNGITAVHDQMIRQGRGHIVNLSSIYGNYPTAGSAVYGATKAAVNYLSEALRQEARGKIKVTNIRPTGVPATSLGESVINSAAVSGILGAGAGEYLGKYRLGLAGELPADETDNDSMRYWAITPAELVDQLMYAINQPWGINISDITVRASADGYVV